MRRRLLTPVLGAAVSVASGTWTVPATPVAPAVVVPVSAPATDPHRDLLDRLDRLVQRHRCSATALPGGVLPVRAIVRGPAARGLRVVSFERGWAAYEGSAPGTLVAVCAR